MGSWTAMADGVGMLLVYTPGRKVVFTRPQGGALRADSFLTYDPRNVRPERRGVALSRELNGSVINAKQEAAGILRSGPRLRNFKP